MQALCRAARLDRVLHAQLAEDLLAVAADGVDAYREALRYLLARQAVVYKPQDLFLARREDALLGRGVEVDDIYVLGVDALEEAVQLIKNGEMTGTVLNDHIGQSHKAVDVAVAALNGEAIDNYYWVDYVKVDKAYAEANY